jgi:hypothetical protein
MILLLAMALLHNILIYCTRPVSFHVAAHS